MVTKNIKENTNKRKPSEVLFLRKKISLLRILLIIIIILSLLILTTVTTVRTTITTTKLYCLVTGIKTFLKSNEISERGCKMKT